MSSPRLQATTQSVITKLLIEEHEHIRALLNSLKASLSVISQRQAPEEIHKAQTIAQELSALKNTHTTCEEEALFAALAKHHPLLILEVEHEELLLKRAGLVSGIFGYSFPESCTNQLYQQGLEYIDLLMRHMKKEEQAIFPLAEKSLSPEEKQWVFAKMEDIRARARVLPTPEPTHASKQLHSFHFPMEDHLEESIHSNSLLAMPNLEVKALAIEAGASLATHWSTKLLLLLLTSGEAQWHGINQDLTLRKGDGIVLDPLLPHSIEAVQDCRFLMVLYENSISG